MDDLPDTPEGLIEELREAAVEEAVMLGLPPELHKQDMLAWQAADMLEAWKATLEAIAKGRGDARRLARDALNPVARGL